jgi:hypothetical protein
LARFAVATDLLSRIDLAFCVDLTSSMTPFIEAARAQMHHILKGVRTTPDVDLRVAIVGYRDHGSLPVTELHPFEADTHETRKVLDALKVQSPRENTDAAEAVFSGLVACLDLAWREGAYKVVVLVGDAPPHACGADAHPFPDRFKDGDPTGLSLDDVTNRLEEKGVFLHALGMVPSVTPHHDVVLERSFKRLAIGTGGAYHAARNADGAMAVVESISARSLRDLEFDRRLFALAKDERDVEILAKRLDASPDAVNAGVMRLRQRGLVD